MADGRIGFDVECDRPGIEQAVRLLYHPDEARHLTPQAALERWVATEAALKAFGASVREAAAVEIHEGAASYRGEPLHRMDVEVFAGAAACVMTSQRWSGIEFREVALADLFQRGA